MRRIAWSVLTILVLYVLIAGPALWLCRRDLLPFDWCVIVYAPLDWAYDSSNTAKDVLDWYARLFVGP